MRPSATWRASATILYGPEMPTKRRTLRGLRPAPHCRSLCPLSCPPPPAPSPPFLLGSAGGDNDTRVVAALAQLAQAEQSGAGVEEAQAVLAVAQEQQKETKKGKSDGGARGGALFWGWRGASQNIPPLPLLQLSRAPPCSFSSACAARPHRPASHPKHSLTLLRALPFMQA